MQYREPTYAADVWDVFWYEKNLQNDVVAVYSQNGTKLISYTYDAYGKPIISYHGNTTPSSVAAKNPFRYRGYYYDNDLGLYYLNSRYYDSNTGRFINADNRISGTGGNLWGYNMFAYCTNNPVNMIDPSGNWPQWIETTMKVVSALLAVTAVVMVTTVSAVAAGTAAPGSLFGAAIFLGASLSGINGGVANEANGNSYINGYLGVATGGTIQGVCSKTPQGSILVYVWGG